MCEEEESEDRWSTNLVPVMTDDLSKYLHIPFFLRVFMINREQKKYHHIRHIQHKMNKSNCKKRKRYPYQIVGT